MGIYGCSYGCFRHWKCHFGACGAPWTKNTKNLKSPRNGKKPLGCQQISLGASKRVPGRQKRRKKNDVFRLFFLDFMKSIFRISRISGFHWSPSWPIGSNYLVRGTLCQKMSQIGWKMAKRQPKTYHKSKNSKKQQKFKNWASELKFGPIGLKLAPNWIFWVGLMGWMH